MKKLILTIIIFTLFFCSQAWATSYYIDFEAGDDSDAGTEIAPWKHFPTDPYATGTSAAHTVTGGNSYLFNRGTAYRGPICIDDINSDGSINDLVKMDGYGTGVDPIITSRRRTDGSGWSESGGVYSKTVTSNNISFVWVGDSDEEDWGEPFYESTTTPGDSQWQSSGGEIRYNPGSGDPVPGDSGFFCEWSESISGAKGLYSIFFLGDTSYFEVKNINFSHGCFHNARIYEVAHHIWFYDCDFSYCGIPKNYRYSSYRRGSIGNAIEIWGGHHIYVYNCKGNYAYDNGLTCESTNGPSPYEVYFYNCEGRYCGGSGGSVKGSSDNGVKGYATFVDCVFSNNGNHDLLSSHYSTSGVKAYHGQMTLINCVSYDNYGAGVELNSCYSPLSAGTNIHGCLIFNNNTGDHEISDGAIDDEQDAGIVSRAAHLGDVTVTNCTIGTTGSNQRYGIHIDGDSSCADWTIENNIFIGNTDYDLYIEPDPGTDGTFDVDRNYHWDLGKIANISGTEYASGDLATWNGLSWVGTDYYADPKLTDTSGDDYSLTSSSPCIDAGLTLYTDDDYILGFSANTDFTSDPISIVTLIQGSHGTAWDIGAYVYVDLEEPSSYYFKGDHETLHLDDTTTHLDPFTNPDEYTYVSVDDNIYVSQTATNEYAIFVWKDKNDNNTDTIKVIYKGKSSLSTSIQPVYLQIYNYNSSVWQQLDMNDNTTADIEFTLQGRLIANVNYYYDVDNWITCRVYQHW